MMIIGGHLRNVNINTLLNSAFSPPSVSTMKLKS